MGAGRGAASLAAPLGLFRIGNTGAGLRRTATGSCRMRPRVRYPVKPSGPKCQWSPNQAAACSCGYSRVWRKLFEARAFCFWHLAVEMWRYCVGEGIATLFIEVTPRVLPISTSGWAGL